MLDPIFSVERDRNFFLEIMDPAKLALGSVGNLKGHQMIGHEKPANAPVNDPDIPAEVFSETGDHYSILRLQGSQPKLRLGGGRTSTQFQTKAVIDDKALMVFRIWLDPSGDNAAPGGGSERAELNPFYRTFGRGWSVIDDACAENGTIDAISTTVPGACALYRIDTGFDGRHRLRVKHPVYQDATSEARYDVYVLNHLQDAFQTLTLEDLPTPVLSVVLDQTRQVYDDIDEEGFAAIGDFEMSGLAGYDIASVVIRVSAEPDESGSVASAVLVADSVKLEAVE